MNKTKVLLIILLLLTKYQIKAQNNITILKVHPIIGDTLDEEENIKYNLFENYTTDQFMYAVYKMENNKIDVVLKLKNGETITIPYSPEKILKDADKIIESKKNGNNHPKKNNSSNWRYNHLIVGGVWIPIGELSKLGIHPNAGYQGEIVYSRFSIGMEASFKFLASKETYYARRFHYDNQTEATNHFFGGYLGMNGGFNLYNSNWHYLRIIGGIALDGFDAFEEKRNLKSESIWTSNFNIGFGYRHKLKGAKFIGLQVKYNHVDYTRSNIVDMSGYPITVLLEYGGFHLKKKKLH